MAKQIKQKSVEVQGEIQEERFLRNKFPDDDIDEIKKGVKKIVFKQSTAK